MKKSQSFKLILSNTKIILVQSRCKLGSEVQSSVSSRVERLVMTQISSMVLVPSQSSNTFLLAMAIGDISKSEESDCGFS